MNVLIKSQSGDIITTPTTIKIINDLILSRIITDKGELLGTYQSEARAKEILKEIFILDKNTYLLKANMIINPTKTEEVANYISEKYNKEVIPVPPGMEIESINPFSNHFEMPRE